MPNSTFLHSYSCSHFSRDTINATSVKSPYNAVSSPKICTKTEHPLSRPNQDNVSKAAAQRPARPTRLRFGSNQRPPRQEKCTAIFWAPNWSCRGWHSCPSEKILCESNSRKNPTARDNKIRDVYVHNQNDPLSLYMLVLKYRRMCPEGQESFYCHAQSDKTIEWNIEHGLDYQSNAKRLEVVIELIKSRSIYSFSFSLALP